MKILERHTKTLMVDIMGGGIFLDIYFFLYTYLHNL